MSQTDRNFEIEVFTPSHLTDEKVKKIKGLKEFIEASQKGGVSMSLMTYPVGEATLDVLAKRRHDLKAALRTFEHSVIQLEAGYHFNDQSALEKIAAMRRALTVVQRDAGLLLRLLEIE